MFNEIVVANKNYAAVVIGQPQNLDKTAIKVIQYDCPPFLLPMRLVNIDNELQLRYEMMGGIRLSYMPMKMKKRELNRLLEQMLVPFMDCADWFLDYHNICLDRDYIMVNQNDYKIKYIYMPIMDNKTNTEEDVLKFLGAFVMEIDLEDDPAYITSIIRCTIGKDASLHTLVDLMKEQSKGMELTPKLQSQPIPIKEEPNKEEVPKQENKPQASLPSRQKYGDNNLMGEIGEGLFGDAKSNKEKNKKENKKETKSKGFFGKLLEGDKKSKNAHADDGKKLNQNAAATPDASNSALQQQLPELRGSDALTENFYTEITEDGEDNNTDVLRMKLESSTVDNVPELMELDMSKGCVIVGRYDKSGKMSADVNFDMSLTFIGRRHARFEKVEEAFFVIDLESKNHTYLNNEELLPNRRYELHKGDCITFTRKYAITYRVC